MASSSSHASIVLATPPPTDLPAVPTVSNATPINARTLLLAPPSVAAHEDWLQEALGPLDRSMTDLQMLDRISVISMLPNTYDLIMIMTSVDGVRRNEALQFLDRKACTKLVRSMKIGARLETQDRPLKASDIPEAVLSGLTLEAGSFMKQELMEKAIPLRSNLGFKTTLALPLDDSDEELIDEDTLLTDEDRLFTYPNVTSAKRRRACKGCTCGNAERLVKAQLRSDELNEIDFTLPGTTGSCNSCTLGDEFRCASCPYLGLPAFNPGEEVEILNNIPQI